jgi:hypothetical protein
MREGLSREELDECWAAAIVRTYPTVTQYMDLQEFAWIAVKQRMSMFGESELQARLRLFEVLEPLR